VLPPDSTAGTPNPNEPALSSQMNHCDIIATFTPRKLYESLLSFQLKSGGKKALRNFSHSIDLFIASREAFARQKSLSLRAKRSELKVLFLKVMINYRCVVNAEREIQ
jgi:hypothetical protein